MKTHFTTLFAVLLSFAARLPAADLVLMSKDTAPLPIILDKDAAPLTRAAANDLAEHLEVIGGKRPAIR